MINTISLLFSKAKRIVYSKKSLGQEVSLRLNLLISWESILLRETHIIKLLEDKMSLFNYND